MNKGNPDFIRYQQVLRSSPFFEDSSTPAINKLLGLMTSENWKAKSFKSSLEVSSTFHLIVSGRLKVFKSNPDSGREHTVFVLSEGDVFDVLSLLDTKPHDVYWEA
ncbi:MAG: cyclic nucleotide-binding domain-containing protein, partial [Robiginitalea sp.]